MEVKGSTRLLTEVDRTLFPDFYLELISIMSTIRAKALFSMPRLCGNMEGSAWKRQDILGIGIGCLCRRVADSRGAVEEVSDGVN